MTGCPPSPTIGAKCNTATAKLEAVTPGGECLVKVGGDWRLSEPAPSWVELLGKKTATSVRVEAGDLGKWDTSLVLFLAHAQAWCVRSKNDFHAESLPGNLQKLLSQAVETAPPIQLPKAPVKSAWALVETLVRKWMGHANTVVSFVGECSLGCIQAIRNLRRFRWMDCLVEMQQCWASTMPIVSLVSFLVGVILAFQAAIQMRQFGASVFVADLVGLIVVREMGPMMAAVIVAGGTGAGFAAQLGNMKVGEEIDALETLGISSVDFLALRIKDTQTPQNFARPGGTTVELKGNYVFVRTHADGRVERQE